MLIVGMTRKSRYPTYFSGNRALYLYIIWVVGVLTLNFFFLYYLFIYK
nr:hypothetical protein [Staphylococcus aureus]